MHGLEKHVFVVVWRGLGIYPWKLNVFGMCRF